MFGNKYKHRYESLVHYLLTWQDMLIDDIKTINDLKDNDKIDECRRDKMVQTSKDELFIVQSCLHKVNWLNEFYD